jgi:hypothetical protein
MHTNNIIPLHRGIADQPRDYAEPFRFIPSRNQPLSFGEKLVAWARRNQFRFAIVSYIVAVTVGCYFAFQLGRGAL